MTEKKIKKVCAVCRRAGISPQNYYAARKRRREKNVDEKFILELAREERRMQPRIGVRKLHYLLSPTLQEQNIEIGRDRMFEIFRDAGMLVKRKPSRPKTTNSRHSLPVFHNLMKEVTLKGPHEAMVSDLTYIRTEEGFLYASLITDAWSRKIIGVHIGDTLEADGCLLALRMALKQLPAGKHSIHHSDRGCQYCCHRYVELLQEHGLLISMTEISHCYENAMAERVNGILKQEYEMDRTFRTKAQAKAAFYQAIDLYNFRRPHLSLNYAFPAAVHEQAA